MSIPDDRPLKLGLEGEITGGQITFLAMIGDDSIELTFDGDEDEIVSAKINGIPVPPDALEGFGDN